MRPEGEVASTVPDDNPSHNEQRFDPQDPEAFWLAQIQDVKVDLTRLDEMVTSLSEDVHHYIAQHDEWCSGYIAKHDAWCSELSKAVRGAAVVLSEFERYVPVVSPPDGATPKVAEGAWIEPSDADVT